MLSDATNPQAFAISGSEPPAPTYTLYDSNAVAIASFLGGPIPGTVLMAINYRRLGQARYAALAMLAGLSTITIGVLFHSLFPHSTSIALALIFLPGIINPKVTVATNLEIYYSQSATRQDAQALGDSLTQVGFTPATKASIFLSKNKNDGT